MMRLMLSRSAFTESGRSLVGFEGLNGECVSALDATNGHTVGQLDATWSDIEARSVSAAEISALRLHLDGFIVTIIFASVLEISFHPEASDFAFDHGSIVVLQASVRGEVGVLLVHFAEVTDVGHIVGVVPFHSVPIEQATDRLSTLVRARVPGVGAVERFTDVEFFTIENASDLVHCRGTSSIFTALVDEVALGHTVVDLHGSSLVYASQSDHLDVVSFLDAGEERGAVVPLGSDVVFSTLVHASVEDHGQESVRAFDAFHTVLLIVEGGVDVDASIVVGQTTFGHRLTVPAFVPISTLVVLFAVFSAAGACSAA